MSRVPARQSGTRDTGHASLVRAETGEELATLMPSHPRLIHMLRFSPDGNRLAVACAGQTIQLWDLELIRRRLAMMNLDWE